MKKITVSIILSFLVMGLHAQNLEIEGKARITEMDTVTDVAANLVRLSDGTLALRQYRIGDMAQGGIVFYINESGEHGLVADTADIGNGIRWYAGTFGSTQAKGDGPFSGEMNTAIIIAAHVAIGDDGGPYAARLCAELQKGGYGDWYLPAKEELNLMYINLHSQGLGGFQQILYRSSTEVNSVRSWKHNFATGEQFFDFEDKSEDFSQITVRAVRAF